METKIKIYDNPQFGKIRIVTNESNNPMFVANDVARILGYVVPKDAISKFCKGGVILPLPTNGGIQNVKFIPESDVYRLIMRSKLPDAEKFQDWVTSEVFPRFYQLFARMAATW